MLFLRSDSLPIEKPEGPFTALNTLWFGNVTQPMPLPDLGYLFILFPLGDTAVTCADVTVDGNHYMLLTEAAGKRPYLVQVINPTQQQNRMMLLSLVPDFIAEMGDFLNIPVAFNMLLHATPLLRGDTMSGLLNDLSLSLTDEKGRAHLEDIYFEVVGQVLQLVRIRHQALLGLATHKSNTLHDLLPRLLQARQFIEVNFLQPIKTKDVAEHVAISEYHFARLFKTAFDVTVHQYVMRLRLDKSRHLLEQPDASVTDVALTVGYNSLSAFINAFRRRFGLSPSRYRAQFCASEN